MCGDREWKLAGWGSATSSKGSCNFVMTMMRKRKNMSVLLVPLPRHMFVLFSSWLQWRQASECVLGVVSAPTFRWRWRILLCVLPTHPRCLPLGCFYRTREERASLYLGALSKNLSVWQNSPQWNFCWKIKLFSSFPLTRAGVAKREGAPGNRMLNVCDGAGVAGCTEKAKPLDVRLVSNKSLRMKAVA